MGKLEDLENQLYKKEGEEEVARRMQRRELFPGTFRKPSVAWEEEEEVPRPRVPEFREPHMIKVLLWSAAALFSISISAFLYFYLGTRGQEVKIIMQEQGLIESGEILTIPIFIQNISKIPVKEAELSIVVPSDSLIIEDGTESAPPPRLSKKIGDLNPGEEGRTEITVRLFGHEGDGKKIEATLLYRPENLRARFSSHGEQTFVIGRVPLAISWEIPETLARGQDAEIKIHYTSNARFSFQNMSVRLEYPPGFTFVSATPKPSVGETIWQVGTVDPGKEGIITVRGIVSGEEGEIKAFQGGIGVFNSATKDWKPYQEGRGETHIAVTPLSIQGFIAESRDKKIVPGEFLNVTLQYRNNTAFTLKNLSVSAVLQEIFLGATREASVNHEGASILDFSSLQIGQGGVFDGATRRVLWAPAGTPEFREIAPGEFGKLEIRIPTKSRPAVRAASDKNLVIRLRSRIEAGGIPKELAGTSLTLEDSIDFKVNSKVLFSTKTLYRSSPILNAGPIPPKVGEKTSYVITLEARNFTSDVEQAEVRGVLLPNVKWEEALFPRDAEITFDKVSGAVRWRIGELKAGTGVATPALVASFQVSVIPAQTDAGGEMTLMKEIHLTGKDAFTESAVDEKGGTLTTMLQEESSPEEWRVAQ